MANSLVQMDCPFCGGTAPARRVAAPAWYVEDCGVEVVIRCDCAACGPMRIDSDGAGAVAPDLQALFAGATAAEKAFLARTNARWLDEVIYEAWMAARLLEAHQAASGLLTNFGVGGGQVVASGGGIDHANVLVLVDAPGKRITMRVHGPEKDEATVRSEVYWLGRLRAEGLRVPRPLAGADGAALQRAILAAGDRFCTAYAWLPGERFAATPGAAQSVALARRIGQMLARMHLAGTDPELPDWFSRPSYTTSNISAPPEALAAAPRGLIHRELGGSNILVDDGQASFIDFATLGWGPLAHDVIGLAGEFSGDARDAFVAAYDAARPLTAAELTWMRQGNDNP